MTLKDLLDGKESRKRREDLDKELQTLVDRIVCKTYRYRDYVIYHAVIPSSKSGSTVTYDVILEVKTAGFRSGAANIDLLPLRIFSNCPSFIFGYAHNYLQNKVLCDWLLNKYSAKVAENAPTKPNKEPLERSVYLAAAYIHSNRMDDENIYKTIGKKLDTLREIINNVRTQEQIMAHVKERIVKEKTEKKLEKSPETKSEESPERSIRRTHHGRTTQTTKDTKISKSSKSSRTTKTTKTTKSTKKR